MNPLEKYNELIGRLESDEIKSEFEELGSDLSKYFGEAIKGRDAVISTNKQLKDKLSLISSELGFDDDFSKDDIREKLDSLTNTNIENIKKSLEERYQRDLQDKDSKLKEFEDTLTKLQNSNNDFLFEKEVSKYLDGFTDSQLQRERIIIPDLKSQMIFKDGKVYARDPITGDVLKDTTTGDPLGADYVVENYKKSADNTLLKAQSQGQGMGTNPQQSRQSNIPTKRSEMNHSQKAQYIKDNGEDAYLKLPN